MFRSLVPLVLLAALPAQSFGPGAVYSLTNDTHDNAVAVAIRHHDGQLTPFARYSTGGLGTGAGLGSQGALASDQDGRWLVAVNPGSDDITLFSTFGNLLLWRRDVAATHGTRPTSVAIHGDLVYALDAGSDDVAGFRIRRGRLERIGNFALSGTAVAAAQVGFDPTGRLLVVTERATDRIDVFPVRRDGTLGQVIPQASAGHTPFGFAFREDGTLIVSEAAGGAAHASTTSSYRIDRQGTLGTITAALPTDQTAACWIVLPRDGRNVYTTNAGSASLTGYAVGGHGALTRLDPSGTTGALNTGARPIDAGVDGSGRTLYVLDSFADEIVALHRAQDGSLHLLNSAWSLPDGAAGVIVR